MMSSDNHDKTRIAQKSQRAGDVCSFDTRKIKKERNEICSENESHTNVIDALNIVTNDSGHEHTKDRANAGSKMSNGFHVADLLQEFIAAKLPSTAHGLGTVSKNDKIRIIIEDSISEESKARVQEIYLKVEQLKIEERLLLYLKLPTSLTNSSGTVDPLRQPLNPLGNRYEIHQTIMWIKTHLEEDPDVSLPKQEVYDEYNFFCTKNSMKPLSTADFGKVMKQVYPRVRPRRLGTRGNSRYCYAGMRKRVKLDTPVLPAILGSSEEDDFEERVTEEMLGAASTLIREWAERTLGHKFQSLSALARHLVQNLCVGTESLAAVCILSAAGDSSSTTTKLAETPPKSTTPVGYKPMKLREAQLQLQKKLQQREHNREQKHRHVDIVQCQNKDKSIETRSSVGKSCKKTKSNQSPQTTASTATNFAIKSPSVTPNRSRKPPRSVSQISTVSPQLNCDNTTGRTSIEPTNVSCHGSCTPTSSSIKALIKNSRKRGSFDQTLIDSETSPEKQARLTGEKEPIKNEDSKVSLPKLSTGQQRSRKISVVTSNNLKVSKSEIIDNSIEKTIKDQENSSKVRENQNGGTSFFAPKITSTPVGETSILTKNQLRILHENPEFFEKNDKLCSIDTDAFDDYLNGGNNSQEPEEELLQYFHQSSSSSSDAESISVQPTVNSQIEQTSRSDKVSQLRLMLQLNLKGTMKTGIQTTQSQPGKQKDEIILPTLLNHQSQTNSRRRVSFETNVVEHIQESSASLHAVPQSPNTRRRIFNFTPISPSPHSPNNSGRISKPNSANASPFVSPRNTPVPRSRSNMAGICRSKFNHKSSVSRSTSVTTPYSGKNETFIVPTSNNETLKLSSSSLASFKNTEVQISRNIGSINMGPDKLTSLLNDINPQKQLLINYPSQENLLEIKNVHRPSKSADPEIIELLNSVKPLNNEHYHRSQSVPLHRMVNPSALMSPISSTTFQSYSVNPSTSSSLVHTPVPSEFDDFGSIGQSDNFPTLDDVDANFISDNQPFLIEDKEITPEINKIFDCYVGSGESGKGSSILSENSTEIIESTALILDTIPNTNLNVQETMLDPSTLNPTVDTYQKIIQSRSYPNTPLPPATASYPPTFTEDSNGSRSYPSTPLHTIQSYEGYPETNEPMLSSPTLNSLNLHGESANTDSTDTVCRNGLEYLESHFLPAVEVEDDLGPLSNYDGLQDVDSLTPLFNEVSDNRG